MQTRSFSRLYGLVFLALFVSCTTTVKMKTENPPLIDMRGIKRIAVVPFTFSYKESFVGWALGNLFFPWAPKKEVDEKVASYLTEEMKDIILEKTNLALVNSSNDIAPFELIYTDNSDVYITGEITDYSVLDKEKEVTLKRKKDGKEIEEEVKRKEKTVHLSFNYRIVRTSDGEILQEFRVSGSAESSEGEEAYAKILESSRQLAVNIISKELYELHKYLSVWTLEENIELMKDAAKDKRMKTANKNVKKRKYSEALDMYLSIYNETGNPAAGYNAAILTEYLGDTNAGLALMQNLVDQNILKEGSLTLGQRQIERMKNKIEQGEYLEANYGD